MNQSCQREPLADGDRYAWKDGKSAYNWPASRLVWANMRKLTRISNYLKKPINQVLVDAVEAYAEAIIAIIPDTIPPLEKDEIEKIEHGQLLWQVDSVSESKRTNQDELANSPTDNVAQLTEQIEVLNDVIDELREQIRCLLNKKTVEPVRSKAPLSIPCTEPAHCPQVAKNRERKAWQPELF